MLRRDMKICKFGCGKSDLTHQFYVHWLIERKDDLLYQELVISAWIFTSLKRISTLLSINIFHKVVIN